MSSSHSEPGQQVLRKVLSILEREDFVTLTKDPEWLALVEIYKILQDLESLNREKMIEALKPVDPDQFIQIVMRRRPAFVFPFLKAVIDDLLLVEITTPINQPKPITAHKEKIETEQQARIFIKIFESLSLDELARENIKKNLKYLKDKGDSVSDLTYPVSIFYAGLLPDSKLISHPLSLDLQSELEKFQAQVKELVIEEKPATVFSNAVTRKNLRALIETLTFLVEDVPDQKEHGNRDLINQRLKQIKEELYKEEKEQRSDFVIEEEFKSIQSKMVECFSGSDNFSKIATFAKHIIAIINIDVTLAKNAKYKERTEITALLDKVFKKYQEHVAEFRQDAILAQTIPLYLKGEGRGFFYCIDEKVDTTLPLPSNVNIFVLKKIADDQYQLSYNTQLVEINQESLNKLGFADYKPMTKTKLTLDQIKELQLHFEIAKKSDAKEEKSAGINTEEDIIKKAITHYRQISAEISDVQEIKLPWFERIKNFAKKIWDNSFCRTIACVLIGGAVGAAMMTGFGAIGIGFGLLGWAAFTGTFGAVFGSIGAFAKEFIENHYKKILFTLAITTCSVAFPFMLVALGFVSSASAFFGAAGVALGLSTNIATTIGFVASIGVPLTLLTFFQVLWNGITKQPPVAAAAPVTQQRNNEDENKPVIIHMTTEFAFRRLSIDDKKASDDHVRKSERTPLVQSTNHQVSNSSPISPTSLPPDSPPGQFTSPDSIPKRQM